MFSTWCAAGSAAPHEAVMTYDSATNGRISSGVYIQMSSVHGIVNHRKNIVHGRLAMSWTTPKSSCTK